MLHNKIIATKYTYVIGDIHGQYKLLVALRKLIPFNNQDSIVTIGDAFNKGKEELNSTFWNNSSNPKRTIDYIIKLASLFDNPNHTFLRGNHEILLEKAITAFRNITIFDSAKKDQTLRNDPNYQELIRNGGQITINSYVGFKRHHVIPPYKKFTELIKDQNLNSYLKSLKYFHDTDNLYRIVHGGVDPIEPDHFNKTELSINRKYFSGNVSRDKTEEFIKSTYTFPKKIIFGHYAAPGNNQLIIMENKIGIDSGATFGGPLSILRLNDGNPDDVIIYQAIPLPNGEIFTMGFELHEAEQISETHKFFNIRKS